ncbi:MAG: metalloregulator ArsR/SmtB family transcription factor [Pseudomonadota bacterium]
MTDDDALTALSAMAHKARLQVVRLLVQSGADGLNAGQIAQALGTSPSAMSFHLSALRDAKLIKSTRHARQIVYSVDFDAMGGLLGYLLHDCCGGNARVASCC